MTIRSKFSLALIVSVLLPTCFLSLMGLYSTLHLSRTLSHDQKEHLEQEAVGVMQTVIRKNVATMERVGGIFTASNMFQVRETLRLLESDNPPEETMYRASDFRKGGKAPDVNNSELHTVVAPTEYAEQGPAPVSYDAPVVFVAPDGSTKDARRLAGLRHTFQSLAPALDGVAFWQFVILDSGASIVYPGHGLLPDDYDGRKGPVYKRIRPILSLGAGSPPSIDPATGQRLVGEVYPLVNSRGEIIGISGVMSKLDTVLKGFSFGTQWGKDAETMFVFAGPSAKGDGSKQLYIILRNAYTKNKSSQSGFLGIDSFDTDDPEQTQKIINHITNAEFGHMKIKLNGEPMLCCFGGLNDNETGLITLVPLKSVNQIASETSSRIQKQAINMLIGVVASVIVFSVLIIFASVLGVRIITRPLATLVSSIREVGRGNLDVVAQVQSNDEVGELAESFNSMVPRLREHLRLSQSLDLAREVQNRLLPQNPPAIAGLDIAARSHYCDETGGDYFDFLNSGDNEQDSLAIAVGDVTGHGVAAALLMATARSLIRMRTLMPGTLAEDFGDINYQLVADTDEGRFITLMYLVLNRKRGNISWVGAGHDPVIIYDPENDCFSKLTGEDLPLGIAPDWEFHEKYRENLKPGMVLFLGTDGIWEMRNPDDILYGKDRLRQCIREHAAMSADGIADAILEDLTSFRNQNAQLDDVTLVIIKIDN